MKLCRRKISGPECFHMNLLFHSIASEMLSLSWQVGSIVVLLRFESRDIKLSGVSLDMSEIRLVSSVLVSQHTDLSKVQ